MREGQGATFSKLQTAEIRKSSPVTSVAGSTEVDGAQEDTQMPCTHQGHIHTLTTAATVGIMPHPAHLLYKPLGVLLILRNMWNLFAKESGKHSFQAINVFSTKKV